ncbi:MULTISPECIES: nitrate- and nitrite sensing domain-containing protein [unclassified Nocardia]|uniref:sensor histidine kinase n=1 Tax=unclassified Nocardia TaxID=2637762 RepID=UPI001CE3CE89|nr:MULTISPECIES: nitrate- and nitrite sensing domain-containing protein [unclassified Nocardia]
MFRARLGVRTRILAIALVPSLTLLVVGVGAAGYLVAEGYHAKQWAAEMQKAVPNTRELLEAVQLERQLTLAQLAGDDTVGPALAAARVRLDAALRGLVQAAGGLQSLDSEKIGDNVAGFSTLAQSMTAIRTQVDAGLLPALDAYNFYNRLLDVIQVGTRIAEQTAPDAEITNQINTGMEILYVTESMSRSNALGLALVNGNGQGLVPLEEFLRQAGFYHTEIAYLAPELDELQHDGTKAITTSPAFQQLTAMENAIAQRTTVQANAAANAAANPASTGKSGKQSDPLPPLPMSITEWQNAATEVNKKLIDTWIAQNKATQKLAEDKAADNIESSLYAGAGVVAVSLAAFLVSVLLANRIIRRLKRLRGQTLLLADERLPEMMQRLRDGETIDPTAESPRLDYGHDEIGQVAKAFQHAHAAAVAGAVAEARTREGVRAVFLNIAHRSQIVVHRQLEILDEAERRQEDPALLDTLFRLDHLATRERRNAENLIILGGGRPGRQWRNPVPLVDLVRSAIGETLDYARVRAARLPEVQVAGGVVADLIHLLAELLDNATAFSPPQSRVEVSGNIVGKGVVVEITDQGMGMPGTEQARVNEMLSDPPDFGVAALSADSRLGLFVVARLATRHGVQVRLVDSDYGGIRAIVLIPSALLAGEATAFTPLELTDPGRRPQPAPQAALGTAPFTAEPAVAATPAATLLADPPNPLPGNDSGTNGTPTTTPDGRPALPRRNRQASLAPQLADPADPQPAATERPERARSAEQARDLMSAIENGTRQGRKPLSDTTFPANGSTAPDEQEG